MKLKLIFIIALLPFIGSCGAGFSLLTPYGEVTSGKDGTVITPNPKPIIIRGSK